MNRLTPVLCCLLLVACKSDGRVVRVLTYNIHHGEGTDGRFDLGRLADVIRCADPDLVALQEVDRGTGRASGVDQATVLGRQLGMDVVFGTAMEYDGGQYGEALLVDRLRFRSRNHALPHRQGSEPRAAVAIDVGAGFRFIGTHLDHQRDEADRLAQAAELNRLFTTDELPTILVGDLNAKVGSSTMEILLSEWTDTAGDAGPTFPSDRPDRRIDYVLVRPAHRWRVRSSRVLRAPIASDHAPLLVELELLPADADRAPSMKPERIDP